jgi:hypothetical protein
VRGTSILDRAFTAEQAGCCAHCYVAGLYILLRARRTRNRHSKSAKDGTQAAGAGAAFRLISGPGVSPGNAGVISTSGRAGVWFPVIVSGSVSPG